MDNLAAQQNPKDVNKAIDNYAFHEAAHLFIIFSGTISAIGISNSSKMRSRPKTRRTQTPDRNATRIITILEQALRLLHPFMPYLTEELWQKLPGTDSALHNSAYKNADATIMLADFPKGDAN